MGKLTGTHYATPPIRCSPFTAIRLRSWNKLVNTLWCHRFVRSPSKQAFDDCWSNSVKKMGVTRNPRHVDMAALIEACTKLTC